MGGGRLARRLATIILLLAVAPSVRAADAIKRGEALSASLTQACEIGEEARATPCAGLRYLDRRSETRPCSSDDNNGDWRLDGSGVRLSAKGVADCGGISLVRSEIGEEKNAHRSCFGDEIWYGLTITPDDVPADGVQRLVLAQAKRSVGGPNDKREARYKAACAEALSSLNLVRPGDEQASPFFALRFEDDLLFFTAEADRTAGRTAPRRPDDTCPDGFLPMRVSAETGSMRILVASEGGALPRKFSAAHDDLGERRCTDALLRAQTPPPMARIDRAKGFALRVGLRAGPQGGGRLRILVDGVLVADVAGSIGPTLGGFMQYWKFGPYGDVTPGTALSVRYRDFARAPTESALDTALAR